MIDPARLRRALYLKVDRTGSGGWLAGGRLVDPEHGCSCPDRMTRGVVCKHEIAARLDALDADVLNGLRELMGPETPMEDR